MTDALEFKLAARSERTTRPMPKANAEGDGLLPRRARQAAEAIVLAMACLSPWAYGAVDSWAQLLLALGLIALAVLGFVIGLRVPRGRFLLCLPSLALGGLCVLAALQSIPVSSAILNRIAPSTHSLITSLASRAPVGVKGDGLNAVAAPEFTLSQNPHATLHNAMHLCAAWVLFQSVLVIGGGFAALRKFGIATIVNATLIAIFSIGQSVTWTGKIYGIRPSPVVHGWMTGGPFIGHSHLAAYLNIGLGFAIGFLLTAGEDQNGSRSSNRRSVSTRGWSGWAAYATGVLIVGVIASHSRNGFLSMVVSGVVTFFVFRPRMVRPGLGIIALLVLVPLFLVAVGTESAFQRIATIADASETYLGRAPIWSAVLQAWTVHPLFGTGLGTFSYAMMPYGKMDYERYYSHAENEYLHYLAEGGVIGLACVILCLVGIFRLGWRARNTAATTQERAVVIGALFAALSLAVESLGDFALHIPAVAVSGIIIGAHLCRLGLDARKPAAAPDLIARPTVRPISALVALGMLGLSVLVFADTLAYARAEAVTEAAGIHAASGVVLDFDHKMTVDELTKRQRALEWALKTRPDWTDGHIWLGLTHLALYQRSIADLFEADAEEPGDGAETGSPGAKPDSRSEAPSGNASAGKVSALRPSVPRTDNDLSDPLWLHAAVHNASSKDLDSIGDLRELEAVRLHLVPAARAFLEARRCCPVLTTSHAYLGGLDFLLENGEPSSVHALRALRVSGSLSFVARLAARVAFQVGDNDLCARCWQHALAIRERGWEPIADASVAIFSPQEILDKVLPPGAKYPVMFADRVYVDLAGYDVRLMQAVTNPGDIPAKGNHQVVVALFRDVLYFRVFEPDGNMLVDTEENQLKESTQQIQGLRKDLEPLWPPHRLSARAKEQVIAKVASIVGLTDNESKPSRDLFLRAALARVANDPALSASERIWWEGQARAGLGEREQARTLMKKALELDPTRGDWWERYVIRLTSWGSADEARQQGLLGIYHCPGHGGLRRATNTAAVIRALEE